ncbi:hypothetical protein [Snodgrassella gandavensis]|uniref:hypothetical protein n=1 Tax=Snodgrassella gandavensis TaxID=2946698 RepID=UPI001EF63F49|nr:hypothetical protein [Snodgrassella gandavensis]
MILNALRSLMQAAQDHECDYDSETDEIWAMSWRKIGSKKPVPDHLKSEYN